MLFSQNNILAAKCAARLAAISFCMASQAANVTWNGSQSTAWEIGLNWANTNGPVAGDLAIINSGTVIFSTGSTPSLNALRLLGGTLTFLGGTCSGAASSSVDSFKPLLDDPSRVWKSAAFSQYPRTVKGRKLMGYSMRTDRYRFTQWLERDDHAKLDAVGLYDHQTDAQENTNIATDPANKALVEKLTAQWQAGWKSAVAK